MVDNVLRVMQSRNATLFYMFFFLIEVLTALFKALLSEPRTGNNLVAHIVVAAIITVVFLKRENPTGSAEREESPGAD